MRTRSGGRAAAAASALAAVVVLAVVALAAAPAAAHDENGLTRTGHGGGGEATAEAKAALADFQWWASSGAYQRAAAEDPIVGPGYVSSPNVTYLGTIPQTTDGVGGRVVGNRLFVTSTKDLQIFDITDPTIPNKIGELAVNVEFENEQVPTDGKVLGISGQTPTINGDGFCPGNVSTGCVAIYDVRGTAPVLLQNVPAVGDHTQTCVTYEGQTCAFMYGSSGNVVDLRGVLDEPMVPATKAPWNWQDSLRDRGFPIASGHHQTEVRPGVLLTASRPIYLISVNAEDGGTLAEPAVLGVADFTAAPDDNNRFTHGVEWANGGTDSIMMAGGETNFTSVCTAEAGAFSTFLVSGEPLTNPTFTFADQVRPRSGNFLDGNPPDGTYALGCSVHWFEPRQDFADGGYVALGSYENGTKFLDIGPDGSITEVGFFLPTGGSTSAAKWAPDGKTVYLIDYTRGLDIVQFDDGQPTAAVPEGPYAAALFGLVLLAGLAVAARRRETVAG